MGFYWGDLSFHVEVLDRRGHVGASDVTKGAILNELQSAERGG